MGEPVRLGSIGLGWWGGVLAKGVTTSGEGEVVACYARTKETRAVFADEHGCEATGSLDELLARSDIDGVLIATPHSTHGDLARAAAAAGKHVFIDKPLTLRVADADSLVEAAAASGVVIQVGHNRRRQVANRRIRSMIDSGDLGEVHSVYANHSAPLVFNQQRPAWRRSPEENPIGGMTGLGVHQIDTFHYLAGPISRVFCRSTRLYEGHDMDDTSVITFEFASGILGQLFTSLATGPIVDVHVHGTGGSVFNTEDGTRLTTLQRGSPDRTEVDIEPNDTIADQLGEFARAIRGEVEPETGGAEGRAVVEVLEAIQTSSEAGEVVEVR